MVYEYHLLEFIFLKIFFSSQIKKNKKLIVMHRKCQCITTINLCYFLND